LLNFQHGVKLEPNLTLQMNVVCLLTYIFSFDGNGLALLL